VLFDKANTRNPINRRISIIVMTRQAEESALKVDDSSETLSPTLTPAATSSSSSGAAPTAVPAVDSKAEAPAGAAAPANAPAIGGGTSTPALASHS